MRKSLPVLLVLGLTAVCFSKELTKKQLKALRDSVATWDGCPPILDFKESDVKKEGNVVTFTFKFLSEDGKDCSAEYELTIDKEKGTKKKHKFECIQLPEEEIEDFDR